MWGRLLLPPPFDDSTLSLLGGGTSLAHPVANSPGEVGQAVWDTANAKSQRISPYSHALKVLCTLECREFFLEWQPYPHLCHGDPPRALSGRRLANLRSLGMVRM